MIASLEDPLLRKTPDLHFFKSRFSHALFLFSFLLLSFSSFAHAKNSESELTRDFSGVQPYTHQWIEAKGKKEITVVGQTYRPRPDLFVMELNAFPDGQTEIKSVKLKGADGKIYEGAIRKLPFSFMPTARHNYQNPQTSETAPVNQPITGAGS